MAKKKYRRTLSKNSSRQTANKTKTLAIVALILNILILPGLGTLIAGKTKTGIWQLVLAIIGIVLSLILIGIPILIAAWIWGLVTGIYLVKEAR